MTILEQIKKSPSAHLVLQEAIKFLSDETEKRTAFRNWIDESMKAEDSTTAQLLPSAPFLPILC